MLASNLRTRSPWFDLPVVGWRSQRMPEDPVGDSASEVYQTLNSCTSEWRSYNLYMTDSQWSSLRVWKMSIRPHRHEKTRASVFWIRWRRDVFLPEIPTRVKLAQSSRHQTREQAMTLAQSSMRLGRMWLSARIWQKQDLDNTKMCGSKESLYRRWRRESWACWTHELRTRGRW